MNFFLPNTPKRPEKPRKKGLTMIIDEGLSVRQVQNIISSSGHIIDIAKFGYGTSFISNNLKKKIKLYNDAGIITYLGGTLFEAFYIRKKLKDYKKILKKLDVKAVEISDGVVKIRHDEKCKIISDFAKNFIVFSEVGPKKSHFFVQSKKWIKKMKKELKAGSWKVIAEASASANVGICKDNEKMHKLLIKKILKKINKNDIIWEAPIKKHQEWFINNLGANANLGNIIPEKVISLEALRLGLREKTFFNYLPKKIKDIYEIK